MTDPLEEQAWSALHGGQRPVFLHFLNREIARSVGAPFDATLNRRRLILAGLLTASPLYSSLAFVWESGLLATRDEAVASLLATDGLVLLSEHATLDGFLHSVRTMYRDDQPRYSMYFEPLPEGVEEPAPNAAKQGSTTRRIESDLRIYRDDPNELEIVRRLPMKDVGRLQGQRRLLGDIVDHREGRALTLSLFGRHVPATDLPPVGRLLSHIHLNEYLQATNADIVTGLHGLAAFDTAAREFPLHDARLALGILSRCGITLADITRSARQLMVERTQLIHRVLLESLRPLMSAAYELLLRSRPTAGRSFALPEVEAAVRALVSDFAVPPGMHVRSLEEMRGNLAAMEGVAAERHPWYRERKRRHMDRSEAARVLIVVASDTERDQVISASKEIGGNRAPRRRFLETSTVFDLGTIAGTEILLGQSEQGTESPAGATLTISDLVRELEPDAVVMVGIAYGLREEEQKLRDVLVSTQVRVADPVKVTVSGGREVMIERGDRVSAAPRLVDRFRSSKVGWEGPTVHFGPIIAKNTLVNSKALRDEIHRQHPDAVGGEMEGAGLYSAAARDRVEWILVKGISDWGFDKDDSDRVPAASNAARYAMRVISLGALARV